MAAVWRPTAKRQANVAVSRNRLFAIFALAIGGLGIVADALQVIESEVLAGSPREALGRAQASCPGHCPISYAQVGPHRYRIRLRRR